MRDGRSGSWLRTPADLLAVLAEQIRAVRGDRTAGVVAKARAIGHLASVALKAIEVANLAARVEMLEAVLKQRDGGVEP
jgi:hypothetical protein